MTGCEHHRILGPAASAFSATDAPRPTFLPDTQRPEPDSAGARLGASPQRATVTAFRRRQHRLAPAARRQDWCGTRHCQSEGDGVCGSTRPRRRDRPCSFRMLPRLFCASQSADQGNGARSAFKAALQLAGHSAQHQTQIAVQERIFRRVLHGDRPAAISPRQNPQPVTDNTAQVIGNRHALGIPGAICGRNPAPPESRHSRTPAALFERDLRQGRPGFQT